MRYTVLISILIIILAGCNKNKYTTTPQLKYKSVNTKTLASGQLLTFTLSFTDAEGDLLADSSLYVEKFEPKCVNSRFKQYYRIPTFPTGKNQSGDITVTYGYNVSGYPPILPPQCSRNDTCFFKFVLRDAAKNKSDTAVSETIVIIR